MEASREIAFLDSTSGTGLGTLKFSDDAITILDDIGADQSTNDVHIVYMSDLYPKEGTTDLHVKAGAMQEVQIDPSQSDYANNVFFGSFRGDRVTMVHELTHLLLNGPTEQGGGDAQGHHTNPDNIMVSGDHSGRNAGTRLIDTKRFDQWQKDRALTSALLLVP